eukprot:jgi/Ulvmu1/5963/UM026_0086.1
MGVDCRGLCWHLRREAACIHFRVLGDVRHVGILTPLMTCLCATGRQREGVAQGNSCMLSSPLRTATWIACLVASCVLQDTATVCHGRCRSLTHFRIHEFL